MKKGNWLRIVGVGTLALTFNMGAQAGMLGEYREVATRTGLGGIATMDSVPRPLPGPNGDAVAVFYNFNVRIDKRGPEKGQAAVFPRPADTPLAGNQGTGVVCRWIRPLLPSRVVDVAFRCR